MRSLMLWLASVSLLSVPIEANAAQYDFADVNPGAFLGARVQIPLGGRSISRPRASLAIAPTLQRISNKGEVRTSIGEGVALSIGSRPTLTLMGMRADQALDLSPAQQADSTHKQGVSTGGWVAIGVGVAAVVGGIGFLYVLHEAEENSD